jgi:MFS family permease
MMTNAMSPTRSPYATLWSAALVANLGDGIGLVILPLLAATLTRDPMLIAGVATAQRLPWLFFSLISGVIVDRVDRRRLLQSANLARAGIYGLLALLLGVDGLSIPLLWVAALLLGVAETLVDNAAFALLPALVARDQLEQSNGRLYTTQTVANEFVGPPLGGGLFALMMLLPFGVNSLFYTVSAMLVARLQGSFQPLPPKQRRSILAEIVEGVHWFWGHRLLHLLGIKAAFEHGCWAATNAVLVLLVQDRLGLDAAGFGALLSAGALGGVLGGVIAARWIGWLGAGSASMLNLLIQGVAYLGIALSSNFWVIMVMLALQSFTGSIGGVLGESFRQAIIPDALRGRVSSAFRLYALGAMSIGAALGGLLARASGLLAPYWVSAAIMFILAIVLLPFVNNRSMAEARK